MRMGRRRFLALSASALGLAGSSRPAPPVRWSGFALGAQVSLTIRAPERQARDAIDAALVQLDRLEKAFSLYRDDSEIVQLNVRGSLAPSRLFADLLAPIDHAHALTDGTFDPTVQTVWAALAQRKRPNPGLVGWSRVPWSRDRITLAPFQQVTFNGIAQGFATDRVRATLLDHGLGDILVNMGEFAAVGGPWHLGIADPKHGLVGRTILHGGAIATTSAAPHLIDPKGRAPRHATVSIEAPSATLADALSTAALFLGDDTLAALRETTAVGAIHLVDFQGRYRRL